MKLSDDLIKDAKSYAKLYHRSLPKQIEYWVKIGKAVEENPDLSFSFIKETLFALEEVKQGAVKEYVFKL